MNKVQEIFETTTTSKDFTKNYFNYLASIFEKIDTTKIQEFIETILETREKGNQIFFIGNGGSAATASHFAADLAVATRLKGKPIKAMSLTDNNAIITAVSNDFGYENLFVKQLECYMNEGDIVVAISASGNSKNVINALEFAKTKKCKTVSLTGFSGGQLKEIADLNIHVESNDKEFGPVEDLHMIFDHIISNYLTYYNQRND